MYFSKLPGYKNFLWVSAFIVIFLGIAFNGMMYFFQYFQKASNQYTHEMVLKIAPTLSKNEFHKQLQSCESIQLFKVDKKIKDKVRVFINLRHSVSSLKQEVSNHLEGYLISVDKCAPLQDTFLVFVRGLFILVFILLVLLIFLMTRYFMAYNYETLQVMSFLGATKSKLTEKLQQQFALCYFGGVVVGLISLKIGMELFGIGSIFVVSFKDYIQSYEGMTTFCIMPVIVFFMALGTSIVVMEHRLKKLS